METGEQCIECGKIWTKENQEELERIVKASQTVVPIEK